MDKIKQLTQMMEHPDRYTDAQWQDILGDEQCREYYNLMSKTDNAVNDDKLSDGEIDEEWNKFKHECYAPARRIAIWRKVAAAFILFVLVSGIAIAAIKTGFFGFYRQNQTKVPVTQTDTTTVKQQIVRKDSLQVKKMIPVTKQYEDTPLESILQEMADYYHVKLEFQDRKARELRLFYKWNQADDLIEVVNQLNNFEQFHILFKDNTLIVK